MPPNYEQHSFDDLCAATKAALHKPVLLVGMMGSGKSSIGPRLARDLGVPFADADADIVAMAGKPISQIFADDGEPAFRQMEADMMQSLVDRGPGVIASGGGALITPRTLTLMQDSTLSIWLQADIPVILRRTRGSDRPLLQNANPAAKLAELMDVRVPLYRRADIHFNTNKGKPPAQSRQLVDLIHAYLLKS